MLDFLIVVSLASSYINVSKDYWSAHDFNNFLVSYSLKNIILRRNGFFTLIPLRNTSLRSVTNVLAVYIIEHMKKYKKIKSTLRLKVILLLLLVIEQMFRICSMTFLGINTSCSFYCVFCINRWDVRCGA